MSERHWSMTPEDAAAEAGVTQFELRERVRPVYLAAERRRTHEGFRARWTKWAEGRAKMPVSVELVLDDPTLPRRAEDLLERLERARSRRIA